MALAISSALGASDSVRNKITPLDGAFALTLLVIGILGAASVINIPLAGSLTCMGTGLGIVLLDLLIKRCKTSKSETERLKREFATKVERLKQGIEASGHTRFAITASLSQATNNIVSRNGDRYDSVEKVNQQIALFHADVNDQSRIDAQTSLALEIAVLSDGRGEHVKTLSIEIQSGRNGRTVAFLEHNSR